VNIGADEGGKRTSPDTKNPNTHRKRRVGGKAHHQRGPPGRDIWERFEQTKAYEQSCRRLGTENQHIGTKMWCLVHWGGRGLGDWGFVRTRSEAKTTGRAAKRSIGNEKDKLLSIRWTLQKTHS